MVDADQSCGGFWSLSMDPILSCSSPLLSTTISFDEELNVGKPNQANGFNDIPDKPTMKYEYRRFCGFGMGSGVPASVTVMYSSVKDLVKDGRKRWKKRNSSQKRNRTSASSRNSKSNKKKSSTARKQRQGVQSDGNSSTASTASSSLSSPTALNETKADNASNDNMKQSRTTIARPTPKAHFESVLDQPYPLFFDIDDLFAEYVPEWDFGQRWKMVTHLIRFLELKVCMEDYDAMASTLLLAPTPRVDKAWRALVMETELYLRVTESIQDFHGRSRQMIHYSTMSRPGKKNRMAHQRQTSMKVMKKLKKRRKKRDLHINSATATATDGSNKRQSQLHRTQALYQLYFQEQMPESGDEIIIVNNGYGIDYEGIEVKKSDTTISSHEYEFSYKTSTSVSAPDDEITITEKVQQQMEKDEKLHAVEQNKERQEQEQDKQRKQVVEEQFYEPLGRFLATITSAAFAVELQHRQSAASITEKKPQLPKEKRDKDTTLSVVSSASNLVGLNWA